MLHCMKADQCEYILNNLRLKLDIDIRQVVQQADSPAM